jgi:hypothetical protein
MATVDVSPAFDLLPNLAQVTYEPASGTYPVLGYPSQYPITAFQTPASLAERQPSGGVYERFVCSFKLRILDLSNAAIVPKPADRIVDQDGFQWTVIHRHRGPASWAVGCVRLAISALNDMVDYVPGSLPNDPLATDVYADRLNVTANSVPTNGIACRIQPIAGHTADQLAKRGMLNAYTVTMTNQILPRFGDTFVCPAQGNERYVIRVWEHLQELDYLPSYTCERQP